MDPEFVSFLTGKGISEARYQAGSLSDQAVLIHEFNESKKIAPAPPGSNSTNSEIYSL
jgi:hypothetical protein